MLKKITATGSRSSPITRRAAGAKPGSRRSLSFVWSDSLPPKYGAPMTACVDPLPVDRHHHPVLSAEFVAMVVKR